MDTLNSFHGLKSKQKQNRKHLNSLKLLGFFKHCIHVTFVLEQRGDLLKYIHDASDFKVCKNLSLKPVLLHKGDEEIESIKKSKEKC